MGEGIADDLRSLFAQRRPKGPLPLGEGHGTYGRVCPAAFLLSLGREGVAPGQARLAEEIRDRLKAGEAERGIHRG